MDNKIHIISNHFIPYILALGIECQEIVFHIQIISNAIESWNITLNSKLISIRSQYELSNQTMRFRTFLIS